ncbi:MAG: hypothetical protein M1822_006547 [Bathelium mastoideum]|nr:MAG: hypothetical protein M1822_006547 [Bathelium mastoideum]
MPPIPIYSDRPINPAKAEDAEPQTAPPPTNASSQPAGSAASNTTAELPTNRYAPAAPGAAPAPAPTGAVTSSVPQVHASTQPLAPTRTVPPTSNDAPPPPQPGAVPIPGNTAASTAFHDSHNPPPPRAGLAPQTITSSSNPHAATITPAPAAPPSSSQPPPPHQLGIPAPSTNAASTRSTTTADAGTTLSYAGGSGAPPALLSAQAQGEPQISPAHPPGYVQNPNADMMSAAQREANGVSGETLGGGGAGVGLSGAGEGGAGAGGEGGLWETAKRWAGEAGKGLQQLEGEAWRRVNGK